MNWIWYYSLENMKANTAEHGIVEISFITSGNTDQRLSGNEISDVRSFKYDEMGENDTSREPC